MVLTRSRQRLPAAFVTCLLLLTGAGEVLGACYCAHRGGEPIQGHGPAHGVVSDEVPAAGAHGHGAEHPSSVESSPPANAVDGHPDAHGTESPAGSACRALCALACSSNAGPTQDVTERAPDLVSCAAAAPAPAVESADMVPPTARPHILPLSQAPPTTS
jgi:hypothetical protein